MRPPTAIRQFATSNAATISFLACYTATVLLGNLIYATSFGTWLLGAGAYPTSILSLPTTFSLGYWALLLSPLVIVPIVIVLTAPVLRRPIERLFQSTPSFSDRDFVVISLIVYGVIVAAFYRSGAIGLFLSGGSAADAIEARFAMQARLVFPELVAIHSIMPFLTYYSFVAFLRERGKFWAITSALSCSATFTVLIFLNMKWPVLLFSIGILVALLMFSPPRYFWVKLIGGGIALVAIYLLVSTAIFRLAPMPIDEQPTRVERSTTDDIRLDLGPDTEATGSSAMAAKAQNVARSALSNAPFLLAHAINRMAVSYPYYYFIFTEKGPVCGTLIQQYTPGPKPCHPSYLVYTSVFGPDGYENRGTAPAAPHITAYAFQGWAGAALGLAGMGILLAFFREIPFSSGPMAGAWTVLGVIVGYHLSQVPGDEIVFYATGVIWPFLLVLAYSAFRHLAKLLQRNSTAQAQERS